MLPLKVFERPMFKFNVLDLPYIEVIEATSHCHPVLNDCKIQGLLMQKVCHKPTASNPSTCKLASTVFENYLCSPDNAALLVGQCSIMLSHGYVANSSFWVVGRHRHRTESKNDWPL